MQNKSVVYSICEIRGVPKNPKSLGDVNMMGRKQKKKKKKKEKERKKKGVP
jgi:hypothetical protein